jgi:hypothetical protein
MSWDGESWRKAAREYAAGRAASRTVLEVEIEPDRLRSLRWLLEDTVSLDRAWHETKFPTALKGRAAYSTLEALMFSLRERGTKALEEVDTRRRLSELFRRPARGSRHAPATAQTSHRPRLVGR